MTTLTRNRQFNFRVNEEILNSAKDVLEKQGMTSSDALNLFVEQIATKQELPIQTEEENACRSIFN